MKLSICIPTHNRARFIGETLQSIVSQANDRVEIVVSDNASEDNTEEIVRSYQKIFPRLVYSRNETNIGADKNYLRSIELGKGDYCWFMGSDDIIEPGGIKRALEILDTNKDLAGISLNLHCYNATMTQKEYLAPIAPLGDRLFTDWKECYRRLFIYYGYLSGQIVKKSLWNASLEQIPISKLLNAYSISYVIGRMLQKNPAWYYCDQKCVGWRSGNDSFLSGGLYKRFALDFGYIENLEDLCVSDRDVQKFLVKKLIRTHFKTHVKTSLFHEKDPLVAKQILKTCLQRIGYHPYFWIYLAPWLLTPRSLLHTIRLAYQKVLK